MRKNLSKIFSSAAGAAAKKATRRKATDDVAVKSSPRSASPLILQKTLERARKAAASEKSAEIHGENSSEALSGLIYSILKVDSDSKSEGESHIMSASEANNAVASKNILGIEVLENRTPQQRKDVNRVRKQRYIFKNSNSRRYKDLMKHCSEKLGIETTIEVFGKLGRETGVTEYNNLIDICMAKAKQTTGDVALNYIRRACEVFVSMRERGLQIEERSYRPILMHMINMRMARDFQSFIELLKDKSFESISRLAYYEMLLWIKVGDEDKIRELCNSVGDDTTDDCYNLAESYLLAFCDSDRKEELLELLQVFDVRRVSSLDYLASIFKSLGRLRLESFAKNFILSLKTTEAGAVNASSFIYDYATCIPKLAVEEIKSTFINMHEQLGVLLSLKTCDMLIKLCCSSSKVLCAMDLLDHMCQSSLDVPVESFHPLLHACEQSGKFELVKPIYSMIRHHKLKPAGDTFKSMISLHVRMKDFEGAYNLLSDAEKINEVPTTSMYNTIMGAYFREKNSNRALVVLRQMEEANVEPDSETYQYLIANSKCERDIVKYLNDMRDAGIHRTKHVYMALINAYARFGNFEFAKQVVLDQDVPSKFINEIKSVLVSALASNGQISEAFCIYDQLKQADCKVEPKALISLIEHTQSEGQIEKLLQVLGDLNGSTHWFDGCSRVVLYCVRFNILSSAIELLKQLKEEDKPSTYISIDMIYSEIWKADSINVDTGYKLFRAIKEELDLHPSRTSLDLLLSSCAKAKDADHAWLVWSEYENQGLPYNALTFLRMYQVLVACGEQEAASKMLKNIPMEDFHINLILSLCKSKQVAA